ncbi:hypothetical protein TeGR_g8062 [Tetraparma gracilis]|uniref:Uncharacterized protein n=1 Tax=Tetraparma gracilis TaxID=2962635 RepID=A0ABQ6MXN3_9STRA|nr:hypothetical protein TeGR_g8062 [Tetraparma gracilis]
MPTSSGRQTSWLHLPSEPLPDETQDNLIQDNYMYLPAEHSASFAAGLYGGATSFSAQSSLGRKDSDPPNINAADFEPDHISPPPAAPAYDATAAQPPGLQTQSSLLAPMQPGLSNMTSIGVIPNAGDIDLSQPAPRDIFQSPSGGPAAAGRSNSLGGALFRSAISNSGRSLVDIVDEESGDDDDDDDSINDEEGERLEGRASGGSGDGEKARGKVLRGVSEGFGRLMK